MDKSVLEVLEQEYKKADKELRDKDLKRSDVGRIYYGGMKHGILRVVSALYGEDKKSEIAPKWEDDIMDKIDWKWKF